MKNFDTARSERLARDRDFTLNGQTFTYRAAVSPESLLEWSAMVGGEFVERDENGVIMLDSDRLPISSLTESEAIAIYDRTILAFLEPGQEQAWLEARRPDCPNPVNLDDMRELTKWLFEENSGRPTGPPSGSSASPAGRGSGGQGTASTDVSRSQAEEPKG